MLFLIAIYSPNNGNENPSKIRNKHQKDYFTVSVVFPGFVPTLIIVLKF